MANIVDVQTLQDGPKNTIVKLTAQLDTSDESYVVKLDPATLSSVSTQGTTRATRLSIRRLTAMVEDGLTVNLWWDVDGTQPNAKLIKSVVGRLDMDFEDIGRLTNNATLPTGKIALSTEGWQSGSVLSYGLELWAVKT